MTDNRVVLAVTVLLGVIVLGGLGSVVALTLAGESVPEVIGLVTTAALGSLASLLVSTKVDPGQLPSTPQSVSEAQPEGWVEKRMRTDSGSQPKERA